MDNFAWQHLPRVVGPELLSKLLHLLRHWSQPQTTLKQYGNLLQIEMNI